jgi:hypothetical protein
VLKGLFERDLKILGKKDCAMAHVYGTSAGFSLNMHRSKIGRPERIHELGRVAGASRPAR